MRLCLLIMNIVQSFCGEFSPISYGEVDHAGKCKRLSIWVVRAAELISDFGQSNYNQTVSITGE
jgi:hypothetical protein